MELIARWNTKINLVSRSDTASMWERHVLDSAQLFPLAHPTARSWTDLGSGAGFPAIVCAIVARSLGRPIKFTLIESDARKAAFLRHAATNLGLDASVKNERIESTSLPGQDIISARALAPLDRLIGLAYPFCHGGSQMLFLKGQNADSELTLARRNWHSRVVRVPSRSSPDATIFKLSEVRPRYV